MGRTRAPSLQFAGAVPLIYLPRGVGQEFTYRIPVDLRLKVEPGRLVMVPFRNKTVRGVVLNITKTINPSIKSLLDIKTVLPWPPLTSGQKVMIDELEKYYGASRTLAYKTVLPKLSAFNQRPQQQLQRQRIAPTRPSLNHRTLSLLLKVRRELIMGGVF